MSNQQILEAIKGILLDESSYSYLTTNWQYLTGVILLNQVLLQIDDKIAIIIFSDLFAGDGRGGPLTLCSPWSFLKESARARIKYLHDVCLADDLDSII